MSEFHPAPAEFTSEQLQADQILRYFHYSHLPAVLQTVSKPFCDLARTMVETLPRNAERSAALRKLLEAKDCAVRANVHEQSTDQTGAAIDDGVSSGRLGGVGQATAQQLRPAAAKI